HGGRSPLRDDRHERARAGARCVGFPRPRRAPRGRRARGGGCYGARPMSDEDDEVGAGDATVTDRVEDTVDYAEVCQTVALVAQQRSYKTLERLCTAIADRLLSDYEAESVWVRAAKPEPPIPLPVQEVSVEVVRDADE